LTFAFLFFTEKTERTKYDHVSLVDNWKQRQPLEQPMAWKFDFSCKGLHAAKVIFSVDFLTMISDQCSMIDFCKNLTKS
jgi:hypothetical protein